MEHGKATEVVFDADWAASGLSTALGAAPASSAALVTAVREEARRFYPVLCQLYRYYGACGVSRGSSSSLALSEEWLVRLEAESGVVGGAGASPAAVAPSAGDGGKMPRRASAAAAAKKKRAGGAAAAARQRGNPAALARPAAGDGAPATGAPLTRSALLSRLVLWAVEAAGPEREAAAPEREAAAAVAAVRCLVTERLAARAFSSTEPVHGAAYREGPRSFRARRLFFAEVDAAFRASAPAATPKCTRAARGFHCCGGSHRNFARDLRAR